MSAFFLKYSGMDGLVQFPRQGVSLSDCLGMLPSMHQFLGDIGLESQLARCRLIVEIHNEDFFGTQKGQYFTTIVHPCKDIMRDFVLSNIKIDANCINCVEILGTEQRNGGAVVTIRPDASGRAVGGSWPDGFPYKKEEILIPCTKLHLNEFGYFYVSLFAFGMISRYYPDIWMREIETYSAAALAASALVEQAAWRTPMLLLGELKGVIPLLED